MAIRQRKNGTWSCYWDQVDADTGKKKRLEEYFGPGPEGRIEAERRNAELGLKNRRPTRPNTGVYFEDLADAYATTKAFNDNSLRHLSIRLNAHVVPFFGHRIATNLTYRDLDLYVAKRRKHGVKDSTIARELTDLQAILNWSRSRVPPLIPDNPVRDYKKPPPDDARILPPSKAETRAIIEAAVPHLRRALLLSYYLGVRPGAVELLSLRWSQVRWGVEIVRVASAAKGGPRERDVPIRADFLGLLHQWHDEDGNPVDGPIVSYRGRPIRSIKTAWWTTLRHAGITRRLRPYDFRHGYITEALEEGADLKSLAEIVGSAPRTLLQHYQHVSDRLRRQTADKISHIDFDNGPAKRSTTLEKRGKRENGVTD